MEVHGILKAFPKVKRPRSNEQKDAPPLKKTPSEPITGTVFQGTKIYIVPAGIGKSRCDIFHRQVIQNGGEVVSTFSPSCTHVIVDDSVDCKRALRLLKVERLPSAVHLVKCTWLSACISEKSLLAPLDYSLLPPESPTAGLAEESNETAVSPVPDVAAAQEPLKILENLTETVPEVQEEHHDCISERSLDHHHSPITHKKETTQSQAENPVLSGKWVCSQPSTTKGENHNKHAHSQNWEPLAKAYTHTGDKWRALGCINALKSYHKPITSYEVSSDTDMRNEMFTNIWGAGAKTAQMWYQQGFRTLEDIRTKAVLNPTLRIGLKHYDDLLERMSRSEASAIEKTVCTDLFF
ncbi:DNA polymerase lambda-like [Cyprinus carpio]|uniref:DNA polymerase lambda n=1 Tax=Cyprinus carpio TaxID=7962 RepID=A0A9Q9ZTW2_CYPCA|nr:DNA polymerase lambda-like [Cyprinus carpio]